MVPTRSVAMLMSFGGDDEMRNRETILQYQRLRYLIEERIEVHDRDTDEKLRYRVLLHPVTTSGGLGELPVLLSSDVVVAVLDSVDPSVIYGLAVRDGFRGKRVLVTHGDVEQALPLELKSRHHVRSDRDGGQFVTDLIVKAAGDSARTIRLTPAVPDDVKVKVDEHDERLRAGLEEALRAVERQGTPRALVADHAQYLGPRILAHALSSWRAYHPYSLWRIKWREKKPGQPYSEDLMIGRPTLVGGNEYFASMYAVTGYGVFPPDPDGPDALTLETAILTLETRAAVDPEALKAFVKDQQRLVKELIFEEGFEVRANVAIHFTDDHPDPDFRGKACMPHALAMRTVGDPTGPHATYLLVVYIDQG